MVIFGTTTRKKDDLEKYLRNDKSGHNQHLGSGEANGVPVAPMQPRASASSVSAMGNGEKVRVRSSIL
jgi:hypothetical protein